MYRTALFSFVLLIGILALTQPPPAQDDADQPAQVLTVRELNIVDANGDPHIHLFVDEDGTAVMEMYAPGQPGKISLEVTSDNRTTIDVSGDSNMIYVTDLSDGLEFAVFVQSDKGSLLSLGNNFGEDDIYLAVNEEHSSIFMDHDNQEKIGISALDHGAQFALSNDPDKPAGVQVLSSPLGSYVSVFDDENNEKRITASD